MKSGKPEAIRRRKAIGPNSIGQPVAPSFYTQLDHL